MPIEETVVPRQQPVMPAGRPVDETRQLLSSRRVEGTPVYNRADQRLGSIHSVMIDKKTGMVDYAVLSLGGIFGLGDHVYPIPWSLLNYDPDLDAYVIDLTREQFDKAPTLRLDEADRPEISGYETVAKHYAELPGLGTPADGVGKSVTTESDLSAAAAERTAESSNSIRAIASLLGGDQVFTSGLEHPLQVHALLVAGLPGNVLEHLVRNVAILRTPEGFEEGLGMSPRTYQRRRDDPDKPLTPEQSARSWKFAEIFVQAAGVFGSHEAAESWLNRPAVGLNQTRPIELLATPVGIGLLEDHLGRLQYGAYA